MDTTRTLTAHKSANESRQHTRQVEAERRLAELSFSEFVRKHNAAISKEG